MATNIPMNELKQVVYDGNDCNGLNIGDMVWRKPYTVTIPTATGVASITVTRSATESNCGQLTTPSTLTSTGAVLYGDTVSVSATAATGYNTPSVSFNSGVDNNNKVIGDVTLKVSRGSVKSYTLSYSTITGVTNQVVTRTSSPLAGAPVNAGALTNGATIYHGDVLSISAAAEEAYLAPKVVTPVTVTGSVYTSSYITAGAVKSYQLTIATIEGVATQTVKRTSSPNAGASTGTLSNGATIYYGDVLSLSATAALGYNDPEITTPVTVTKDVNTSTYIRHGGIMSLSAPVISEVDWHDENLIRFKVTNNNGVPVTALINVNSTRLDTEIAANSYEYIYYNTPTWDGAFIACQLTAGPAHSSATTYYSQCKISYPAKPTGVGSFIIYRNGTVAISNPSSEGHFWVDRFDKIYATAVAATGYNDPSISGVGTNSSDATTVNGPITIGLTAGAIKMYTVTFSVGQSGYGTVSPTSITVPYGTTISATNGDWSVLSFGSTKVTASPAATTAEYTYAFSNWTDPGTTVVQGNMNMTANFSRTKRQYVVTIARNNTSYGTVSKSSVTVDYGTAISASGATLTVGSNTITASPAADTAQYDYEFSSWTGASGTVTGAKTITANFTQTTRKYKITIVNAGYGTVKLSDGTSLVSGAEVNYGTVLTIATSANTAQYTYSVSSSTGTLNTEGNAKKLQVDGAETITFSRTVNKYAITINNSSYGTVKAGSTTLSSGATVDYGTVLTITPATQTSQYTYSASSTTGTISNNSLTVDGAETITFNRDTRNYTVTFVVSPSGYGTVSHTSVAVPYGTAISGSSTSSTMTIGSYTINATAASQTAEYTYAFSSWTTPGVPNVGADMTMTANFTRTKRKYKITINNPSYGTVKNGSTTLSSGAEVEYGTILTISTTAATGYTTTVSSSTGTVSGASGGTFTVDGAEIITFTRTPHTYSVVFNGNGATSGTMSNQSFTYGTAQALTANAFMRTYTVTYEFNGGSGSTGVANTKAMSMFNGWATSATGTKVYDNQQSVSNLTSTNNGTVNLYANWTLGSVTLPTATRTGYNFMGWSTSSTATTGSTGTYTPTGNVTLYAIWQIKTFTVTVACNNADYGSVSQGSITSVPYGTSISTSSNVLTVGSTTVTATPASATAQYNYAFSSWTGGSGTVTSNTTITANFERSTRKYTISYPAMPTGVASFKIYHNGSTVVNNPTSAGSVSVTYGNVYASATAATGYEAPTITGITTSTSGAVITSNLTVTLTAGAKLPDLSRQTIWSGSKSITLKANQTGELSAVFNFNPYPASGTEVYITCAYGVGGTYTAYTRTVTYNADGSYTLNSPITFTNSSTGAIELKITGFDATNLYYTKYGSVLSTLKVSLVELLAPAPTKLEAPDILECYLDTGTELIIDITNNNSVDVTWYATVYDTNDMIMGSGSNLLEANTTASGILLDLDSSITGGYVEVYFEADGYENSDIIISDF